MAEIASENIQNLAFLEHLYADYLRDPQLVDESWRQYFRQYGDGRQDGGWRPAPTGRRSLFHSATNGKHAPAQLDGQSDALFQERIDLMVRNFRVRGHIVARIDPLKQPAPSPVELDPAYYGFTEADYDRVCSTERVGGFAARRLGDLIESLQQTYCRYIGVQFMHIDSLAIREWLQDRMESSENRIQVEKEMQLRILKRLTDAVVFEEFIQKRFQGAKSFSLEGAETLIPLLDLAIEQACDDGVNEIVIGMGHRGRLNVLANILRKGARHIFREFETDTQREHADKGDVMYHLGHSHDWKTLSGKKVHLSLCFNPSHLEFVDPVALGRARAKQDRFGDTTRRHGMALIIHGDAAFAGEGVVQEMLNLSQLEGYRVGGTLHVIVNNQLGFTTLPGQGRSTTYCTDVAKMLQSPIFHVNGEQPEAVAQVVRLALDFRREFQRDVVIDMYGYRLRGHNEGDEPTFTQPVMYRAIAQRPSVRESYLKHMLKLQGITTEEAERIEQERRRHLEQELETSHAEDYKPQMNDMQGIWKEYRGGPERNADRVKTGVDRKRLVELLEKQTVVPESFHMHPKIERAMERRRKMVAGEEPLDWAAAESLALASLATEGVPIRITGQDTERGTFSQRHSVLHDYENGKTYKLLQHLSESQAPVELINSPLSEAAVLGFEYGYSLDRPEGLIGWEAQFGDFMNAAQVIIDQFIASAEKKWHRLSGVVLLLPHGFEGMGPEHSSARIERFLSLAAEDNMQIVVPSTPAQYFHVLRRQVLRRWRKPLVIFTPKSLLRLRECTSTFEELDAQSFRTVIEDDAKTDGQQISRVLLCSGKVYYDLVKARLDLKRSDVAIVRIEQLYPFPEKKLIAALAKYTDRVPVVWVQEEPANMGAWPFLRAKFCHQLFGRLSFEGISRPESASPATGSKTKHKREQDALIAAAFGKTPS